MGDQKGELSCSAMIPESNRNKKDFFSGNNSANEKPRTLFTRTELPASFSPPKSALLPFLNWVLSWSWINPSVLEKYLTVYLIQTKKTDKVPKLLFQEMKPSIIYHLPICTKSSCYPFNFFCIFFPKFYEHFLHWFFLTHLSFSSIH